MAVEPANDTAIPATAPRGTSKLRQPQRWYTAEIERLFAADAAAHPEHAAARAHVIRERLRGLVLDDEDLLAVPVALRVLHAYEARRVAGMKSPSWPLLIEYDRIRGEEAGT